MFGMRNEQVDFVFGGVDMLEKMDVFFENRLEGYDEHMLNDIYSAREFYAYTADCLPMKENCAVLDLGCGTGLELEKYFSVNPSARVTGIDLSEGMLSAFKKKFKTRNVIGIMGSYFDAELGENAFDAAVSVESLHHFTMIEKIPLYKKLCKALRDKGYFILTDYFALSEEEELFRRKRLTELKMEQGIEDNEFYHYDTPLTVEHESEALMGGGFSSIQVLNNWGATFTLKAVR